jgi:hypothetical protein
MIFVEMKNHEEQDLELAEDRINKPGHMLEYSPVPFISN